MGSLALLILLDRFPRTAFRGSTHMYATDPLALHFALVVLERDQMDAMEAPLRLFFYLPFAPSENLADQDVSVLLNAGRVPTGTPQPFIVQLRDAINKALRTPALAESLLKSGFEPLLLSTPEAELALNADAAKWAKVIRDSNIRGG